MKITSAVVLAMTWTATLAAQTAQTETTDTAKKALPRIVIPPDKPAAKAPAGTTPTAGTASGKAAPATGAKGGTPAASGTMTKTEATRKDAGKKDAAKKDEKAAKIEGIEIPRGKGFLGIQIVDATFKLSFYDDKKNPVAADVDRAALRWDPKYKVGEDRVVLTPSGDGKALTSAKNIRPPYNFKLFVTLIKDAGDGKEPVNESFTVDFKP